MYLLPAIDLRNGQVVRLHQGDYEEQTTYSDDPVAQAKRFADAGATWLHMVDLDGARSGRMAHVDVIERICEATPLKIEIGGGVRDTETIEHLLAVGAQRVILGTAALRNWQWFRSLMEKPMFHGGRIVLSLDARAGMLAVSGWERTTETTALEIARNVSDWPLGAIVYTDIATDGTMKGPNLEATAEMAHSTGVPIIASGGVGTLDDLRRLRKLSIAGAIVGRALYENAFTLDEAIEVFEREET